MKCPFCSFDETKVVETRETGEDITRRRRECMKCSNRFTTYERVENSNIRVVKKDGTRETFDRDKIKKGVIISCQKRDISADDIDKLVDSVEQEIRNRGEAEISTKAIGQLVIKKLKKLDKVAYIRFASVYKDFADISDFEKELKNLLKKS